jgi:hypothetical protein
MRRSVKKSLPPSVDALNEAFLLEMNSGPLKLSNDLGSSRQSEHVADQEKLTNSPKRSLTPFNDAWHLLMMLTPFNDDTF